MIRLAIAGLGRWGKVLVDSVQGKSATTRFTHAVTRDPARSADYLLKHGIAAVTSLDQVLADPAVDGIVLATPHSRHADEIIACAKARKPVFVEKPVTLTHESGVRALAAAREAGIVRAAGFNRRWLTPVAEVAAMIRAGDLGEVLLIETNFSGNARGRYAADHWRVAEGESPAGGLAGSGIHMIDTMIHLAGPIGEVFAVSSRRVHDVPLDDTTAVILRHRGGATSTLQMVTASAPMFRICVFGTKGSAEIRGKAEQRGSETLDITPVSGEPIRRTYAPFDIERAELEAFAAAIAGMAAYPITDEEVLNGIAAFEGVSASLAARGPVTLPGGAA